MAKGHLPDDRLVYLHCASIFSGQNAKVRKLKITKMLLEKHAASISGLLREYSLSAIASRAKELLMARIFESSSCAKQRYPDLFLPTFEAKVTPLQMEMIKSEAKEVQDGVMDSDEEDGGVQLKDGRQQPEFRTERKIDAKVRNPISVIAAESSEEPPPQAQHTLPIPKLHPIYLPYRTQHVTLVRIQSLLEACCLDFGNAWFPHAMKAWNWDSPESIELTQWTNRCLKLVESLPSIALTGIPGKSIKDILWGTNPIRHSAVHRERADAAMLLGMVTAALIFTKALKDPKRANEIIKIKARLELSIEQIVTYQELLEHNVAAQLEDIARRRKELDELEQWSIQEMLSADQQQRIQIGSAFETFVVGISSVVAADACNSPYFSKKEADVKVQGEMADTEQAKPEVEEKTEKEKVDKDAVTEAEDSTNNGAGMETDADQNSEWQTEDGSFSGFEEEQTDSYTEEETNTEAEEDVENGGVALADELYSPWSPCLLS
ncbi:MAG: hypothetical protein Q9169_008424 [Polycauliona sp. 2 TL-2023]